jgi:DNA (cytosine-5)-methyltransferase 1
MEAGLLDAAPIWTNLKTFPWSDFRDRVDILSGGYPCQPFSAAGKRLGKDDPRHLWPWIADGIVSMRPRICFFENVEGHISLGLRDVIEDLERLGYDTTWGIFSAREVGAPHQRKRVFILGVNNSKRLERINAKLNYPQGWEIQNRPAGIPDRAAQPLLSNTVRDGSGEGWIPCKRTDGSESFSDGESRGASMANASDSSDPASRYAEADRLSSEHRSAICAGKPRGANATAWPSRPGQPQHEWEPPRVVANTESKRAIREIGCGGSETKRQWQSLSWEFDSTSEISVVGNAKHDGSHQRSEESRGEVIGSKQGRLQELEGGSSSVGNTSDWSNGQQPTEQQGRNTSGRSSEESGAMGNTESKQSPPRDHREQQGSPSQQEQIESGKGDCGSLREGYGEIECEVGRDSDGSADWMDNAELFVTSDNRTDELRLLGNGVVPATAERAFLTLMDQLLSENL